MLVCDFVQNGDGRTCLLNPSSMLVYFSVQYGDGQCLLSVQHGEGHFYCMYIIVKDTFVVCTSW